MTSVHLNPFTGLCEAPRGWGAKDKIKLFSCELSDEEMAESELDAQ